MTLTKPRFFFAAAVPLQVAFLCAHLVLVFFYPKQQFLLEALPVAYLAFTYIQWLSVAALISFAGKNYPIPILMHLPHLLSFFPLIRHILLTSNRIATDQTSLTLAWTHAVATHSFSLVAAWLWQVRRGPEDLVAPGSRDTAGASWREWAADAGQLFRKDFIPLTLYAICALTTILLYAGGDFSFAKATTPYAVGAIQLLLNLGITVVLLHREHGGLKPLATLAAVIFSVANAALLFDKTPGDIGVELALAATSFTQIFSLFVFLMFSRRASTG